jgi:hypothetical protein
MKRVYTAQNPPDAHLLKGILESAGIAVAVLGEALWSVRGEVPIAPETCPSVWVLDESDYDRALEVISALHLDEPSLPEGEEWQCGHCGEMNDPQFTECWKCGKER